MPGAVPGAAEGARARMSWKVEVPAARGCYEATVTVVDDDMTDERSLAVEVSGSWEGTGGRFMLPGGVSEVFDFGEPVKVSPAQVAASIVATIEDYERTSPGLALQVACF